MTGENKHKKIGVIFGSGSQDDSYSELFHLIVKYFNIITKDEIKDYSSILYIGERPEANDIHENTTVLTFDAKGVTPKTIFSGVRSFTTLDEKEFISNFIPKLNNEDEKLDDSKEDSKDNSFIDVNEKDKDDSDDDSQEDNTPEADTETKEDEIPPKEVVLLHPVKNGTLYHDTYIIKICDHQAVVPQEISSELKKHHGFKGVKNATIHNKR